MDLLDTPLLNKGTAFTAEERNKFGLHGILPLHIEDLEEQVVRAYEAYQQEDNDRGAAHLSTRFAFERLKQN
jgi:malate dehydrogenase (oxaloacetate-decarboxylating)